MEGDRVALRGDLLVPEPVPGSVRVRVHASSVNAHEVSLARHPLVRLARSLARVSSQVETGLEFAGVVDADGQAFHRGDRVMGYVNMVTGLKPHAEYVVLPESQLARVPPELTLAEAAALPLGAQTALVALHDVARVEAGQAVLVLGASGGVGVMAVQLAQRIGARVTAVASGAHLARLEALGADRLVDYRTTSLSELQGAFDAVLDFSNTASLAGVQHLLAPAGSFVPADPVRHLRDVLLRPAAKWLMVDRGDARRLEEIAELARTGQLQPVVDSVFALDAWRAAVARSEDRARFGRVVLRFAGAGDEAA
ncbi:MAG: NAD(P)-dependent alcohol dehydrogenase [Myxococcota bacterium]